MKGYGNVVASRANEEWDTVYIRWLKTIDMLFESHIVKKTTKKHALFDSRAMENFIDKSIWRSLGIRQFKLVKLLTVHNIARTENC